MPAALLFDNSGSMGARDIEGSARSRWDNGLVVLNNVVAQIPAVRIVTFGLHVQELHGFEAGSMSLPPPMGGTPLHAAFELAAANSPRPDRIVVVSDGLPDDAQAAFLAARTCAPCVIDALFVGRDGDRTALAFMRALALMGGRRGVAGLRSLSQPKALASEIRGLIGSR
jgi:hypothetical protein